MKAICLKHPTIPRFCAAVVLATAASTTIAVVPEAESNASASTYLNQTDRLIVKYKNAGRKQKGGPIVAPPITNERAAVLQRVGRQFGLSMKALHAIGTGAHVIKLDRRMPVAEMNAIASQVQAQDPSVEYAEPDRMMKALFTPNDPRYSEQWGYFENTAGIRMPAAWDKSTGAGVTVAVIDTGYRAHADMSGKFVQGYDFIRDTFIANDGNGRDSDASDPGDAIRAGECGSGEPTQDQRSSWHGMHVAGTISANSNNSSGVAGVAFGARILPVRVLGKCGGYTSDIADAIIWSSGGAVSGVPANANKAAVINMSLGGSGACDTTTQNAINSARSRGTVVIVAAGNANANAANFSPASCQGVVTVAAVNRSGGRAYYSNYGTVVDVAAPGGDARSSAANGILSTLNSGTTVPGSDSYAFYQGTSMAAPHVAGVAALMLSTSATLTPDEIESKLKSTARAFPATCSGCGTGIVDASAALNSGTGNTSSVTINEAESNGTTSSANSITNRSTTVNANMGSTSDNDYFKLQLPAGATLTSTLTPNSTSDYDLYVYNSNGTLIGSSENGTGSVDSVSVKNTGSSTFTRYVRIRYYSGGTGSTSGKYTLKLAW